MLRNLQVTADDSTWPYVTITVTVDSDKSGKRAFGPTKAQYDLAHGKAEELTLNALQLLMQDVINSRKTK